MASMMLTYSWLKFSDMSLFTMCVVICIQTSNTEGFVPKDQVRVPCIDVSCVGRRFVLITSTMHGVNNSKSFQ
jgi:hypothetical protein